MKTKPLAVTRVLFICSRNRLRSPTAEEIFSATIGWEVASAGLSPDAEEPLTGEVVQWADLIFVMEKTHRSKLTRRFANELKNKRVICLNIPDNYQYMQPELIALLQAKVKPFL